MRKLIFSLACSASTLAHANFYIDYQGLDKEQKSKMELPSKEVGPPLGYKLLSDSNFGLIHEIGKGKATKGSSASVEPTLLRDALQLIMPKGWQAYVDQQFVDLPKVTWEAVNEPWTDIIVRIGVNFGLQYVVDWDQQLIQITNDPDFTKPDFNEPTVMNDPETGKSVFIYSTDSKPTSGYLLIDGEMVKVTVK